MSLINDSADAVRIEIYRRAVQLYRSTLNSWIECLSEALTSIQLEMDVWLMAPAEA